uniref:Cathepsin B cysteine proteinase 6 n=1 Tax=Ascaris suum TaxID=6253 RepID=F1L6N3_ASCSU
MGLDELAISRRRCRVEDSAAHPSDISASHEELLQHPSNSDCDSLHIRRPLLLTVSSKNQIMKEKEDRSGRAAFVSRRTKIKCLCGIVAILILLGISFIAAAIGFYLKLQKDVEEVHETKAYLMGLVQQVNQAPELKWKAKYNPFGTRKKDHNFPFDKNSTAIREYLNRLSEFFNSEKMKQHLRELTEFPADSLPSEFDARRKWSYCSSLHNVPNQGGCGACYAVAAVGVASDRACIASNGTLQSMFSEEDVLGCCAVCGNCYGGDPLKALVYWVDEGLVTGGRDGCRPYSVDLSCGVPCSPAVYPLAEYRRKCYRQCQDIYFQYNYESDKHYGSMAYSMFPRTMSLDNKGSERVKLPTVIGYLNETSDEPLTDKEIRQIIMKELYLWGPMTMAFPVTEEFLHYSSGVFSPFPAANFSDRIVYWHVARLIGWGKYDGDNHYWLAVNSFGRHWGDDGVFRIDTQLLERFGLEYETALP